jgi:hypothetical protein
MFRDRDGWDAASEEPVLGLAEGSGIVMRSEEAQVGKRVRIRNDHRKANLRGREGTISHRWGNPDYPALDVLLDDGDWQLFWYHELEEVDQNDRDARPQDGFISRP